MKCQYCSNPATVHLTDIVNKKKKELHLCQSCAEQQQLIKQKDLNLSAILQTLIGPHVGQANDELARLVCPYCGIKYMEFRAEGRLGCPHDYVCFQKELEPLLINIHGETQHIGKVPKCCTSNAEQQTQLIRLRREMKEAVADEEYERASLLRDQIKEIEKARESETPS